MKVQAKPQESRIKIIPYDKVKDLKCSNQITLLKDKLHESSQIIKNGEFYIQMPKTFVNSVLFFLLGQYSQQKKEEEKNPKKKNQKNDTTGNQTEDKQKVLIKSLMKKISPRPKLNSGFRQGAFINHIHDNCDTIAVDQMIVELGIKVYNKIGPNKLQATQQYQKVYFNLQNYEKPSKPGKNNKNVLICRFDQTEDQTILCFFEATKQFSKNSIDQIMATALKQQKKELPKIQGKEIPKAQIKQDKKQENSDCANSQPKYKLKHQLAQQGQQPKMQEVEKKKQQQKFSLFQILSFIFLAALIFIAWHEHEYQGEFTQPEFYQKTYKINEFQIKILQIFKESRQYLSPYKESVAQWSSEYLSPWVDPISGTLSEIVNHEIVTNVTSIVRNDLYLGFKAVEEIVGQIFVENQVGEQSSQQQLL